MAPILSMYVCLCLCICFFLCVCVCGCDKHKRICRHTQEYTHTQACTEAGTHAVAQSSTYTHTRTGEQRDITCLTLNSHLTEFSPFVSCSDVVFMGSLFFEPVPFYPIVGCMQAHMHTHTNARTHSLTPHLSLAPTRISSNAGLSNRRNPRITPRTYVTW